MSGGNQFSGGTQYANPAMQVGRGLLGGAGTPAQVQPDAQRAQQGVGMFKQFQQQGQQYLDQNYNPQLQQQFRQAQDQIYGGLLAANPKIDQSTYEGFQAANALRAARPQTNAAGWNDVAHARSRAQAHAQMTPEQWAERQRIIAGYERAR